MPRPRVTFKLFVDDVRPRPTENGPWLICRDGQEAIEFIDLFWDNLDLISLDHDLGEGPTGYDVAKWMEEQVLVHGRKPIQIEVHSANPVGRDNILAAARSMWV